MTATLILAGCGLVAWITFFYAIPELTKYGALVGIHNARDELYEVARAHPAVRETLFYRDLEYIFAVTLHVIRDLPYAATVQLLAPRTPSKATLEESRKRVVLYRRQNDAFTGERGEWARKRLSAAGGRIEAYVALRVLGGNPFMMIGGAAVIAVALVGQMLRRNGGSEARKEEQLAALVPRAKRVVATPARTTVELAAV